MKKLILAAIVIVTMLTVSCETTPTEVETLSTIDSMSIDSTITALDSLSIVDTIAK
jgi:hypothetical protein